MITFGIDPGELITLQSEIIAALILIIPTLAAAIYASLQAFINRQKISALPTHDEVATKIHSAVNEALTTNGTTPEKSP